MGVASLNKGFEGQTILAVQIEAFGVSAELLALNEAKHMARLKSESVDRNSHGYNKSFLWPSL